MNSPRIVFDGAVLGDGPPTGVARAFVVALEAWLRLTGNTDSVLLLREGQPRPEPAEYGLDDDAFEKLETRNTPALRGGFARLSGLGRVLQALDAALLHSPVAALPWRAPCPMVATVHDVPWQAMPRFREPATQGPRARLALRLAARRADVLLVPSRATADAVLRAVGGGLHARIEIVPHGVPLPHTAADRSDLTGPFLAFGDARPRKNLPLLRRAHACARRLCADLPGLRILGPGLEWVDEATKHLALRTARALLVPSLHEGFGLPMVEAFGHGLPVVCSNRSSLPEVAGDAAWIVAENDEESWARAMIRIHDDRTLRDQLARRGRARAQRFLPAATAARWQTVHASLLRPGPREEVRR